VRGFAAAALAAVTWTASAQSQSTRTRVDASIGFAGIQHRDATASPVSYAGFGGSLSLDVDRVGPMRRASLNMRVAVPRLSSSVTEAGYPREEVSQGDLAVSLGWRVRRNATRARLYLGPRLSFTNTYWRHIFPPNVGDEMGYLFANIALAPEVSGFSPVRQGTLEFRAAVPLVALVEHPYTDVRVIPPEGLQLRWATVTSFQQANLAVAYRRSFTRRVGWVARYRARVTRYVGAQPYRAAENALDLGAVLGAGSAP